MRLTLESIALNLEAIARLIRARQATRLVETDAVIIDMAVTALRQSESSPPRVPGECRREHD